MSNQMDVKLNLNHSPLDRRDYTIKVSAQAAPLKFNNVDLSNYCTSVKNQGSIGSCTAFAVIGLMEYIYKRALNNGQEDIYSEKFTYYDTRVNQLKWPASSDSGAYLRSAITSVVKQGAAPENLFPYNNFYSEIPPPSAFQGAQKNQVIGYAGLPDGKTRPERQKVLQDLKQLLQEGHPVVAGFVCYDSLWQAKNGVVPLPSGRVIGGHAILIVGYDDGKSLLKFKNSWGVGWGDKGYGYLPYEYLLRGELWDMWTVFKQENFSDTSTIQIEKPPEEEKKKELDEQFHKKWGDIVSGIQELLSNSQNCAGLEQEMRTCFSEIHSLSNRVDMIQRQLALYKKQLQDKVELIQKKVIECYNQVPTKN